ncbi:MAG TPA: type II toxin-antitoxin system death-on-curing family toxin [Acidimicrobiales bacterium]|nr:type II toxin-antitoxin system death-on-curing family toxin [Acidimicrobiales bacterium]
MSATNASSTGWLGPDRGNVKVQYLGLGDLLLIASEVLGVEVRVLAKAANLASGDSVLNAPAAAFGGVEFYPDFTVKVAVLGFRLARNHPLPDGNKRTAFLAMIEFAERNGRRWKDLDENDTVDTMVKIAAGVMTEDAFARWVSERLEQS